MLLRRVSIPFILIDLVFDVYDEYLDHPNQNTKDKRLYAFLHPNLLCCRCCRGASPHVRADQCDESEAVTN